MSYQKISNQTNPRKDAPMKRTVIPFVFLIIFLFFAACTHVHKVKGYDADPAGLKASKNKKVAVVFLEPNIQDTYRSSAQGHTFVFEGAKLFLQQAYATALQGSVASTEFFDKEPGRDFDVYLYPKLNIEVKAKLIGAYCQVNFEMTAKNRYGKEIGRKSKTNSSDIIILVEGNETCKNLFLHTYYDPTYEIFQMIDGL
jgi:hypothetical protein